MPSLPSAIVGNQSQVTLYEEPANGNCAVRIQPVDATRLNYIGSVIQLKCQVIVARPLKKAVTMHAKQGVIINRLFSHVFDQNSAYQRYFLKVLAVTATLRANIPANGKTIKLGCALNGRAR